MMDNLQQLQQMIARRPLLECKLYELHNQRRQYENSVISLRAAFHKEQGDVEKLEGRSLANYFYQVIGKLDERMDQEHREAYAAKVKLETAERELAGIQSDIQQIQRQITEARVAEAKYKEAIAAKRIQLKLSGTEAASEIIALEDKISALQVQKKELREAISAGYSARGTADRIISELEDADGWNTWDIIGGGGMITHMAKHSHLDEAQYLVQELQSDLRRFKTELADIQIRADMQINIEGFLRFADYFFDGLFADWAVGDKITQSRTAVNSTRSQIDGMLGKLSEMESNIEREIAAVNQQLEEQILHA